jgi:co-chaperonin GroES (HSP10)
MKPIKDKILVRELDPTSYKQKVGNIMIDVDPGCKDYVTAEVVAFGDEVKELKVGDKLFIYPNSGKLIRDPETNQEMRVITTLEVITVL